MTIGGVALASFIYDTGYWSPFGGVPGAAFVPMIPFLALGVAETWRRAGDDARPSVCGGVVMAVATLTYP